MTQRVWRRGKGRKAFGCEARCTSEEQEGREEDVEFEDRRSSGQIGLQVPKSLVMVLTSRWFQKTAQGTIDKSRGGARVCLRKPKG